MDWKKERDALIAQTFAFVQSVTGRTEETARREAPMAAAPVPPPPEASAALSEAATIETPPIALAPIQSEPFAADPADPAPAAPVEPLEGSYSAALSTPTFQSGVKAEIQARIDSFRALQDRFRRERAEYCSATLQRLRATIEAPLPHAGEISQPNGPLGRKSSARPATNASETLAGSRSSGNVQGPS
jgi:hypothetical protein